MIIILSVSDQPLGPKHILFNPSIDDYHKRQRTAEKEHRKVRARHRISFGGGYRRSLQYAANVKIPRNDDETGVTGDVGIRCAECAEGVAFRKASDVDLAPLTEEPRKTVT